MAKRLTTSEFLQRAVKAHGDRYDYTNTAYVNKRTKVSIKCTEHGEFRQDPLSHTNGAGCNKCLHLETSIRTKGKARTSLEDFKRKANTKHLNNYSYESVVFNTLKDKVIIHCNIHGDFIQTAADHLTGNGCQECGNIKTKEALNSNSEEFIHKSNKIHGDKYEYFNVIYTSAKEPVSITCKLHGDFSQLPNTHLSGSGCRYCRTDSVGWTDAKWEAQGLQSKYFKGFKLYVVRMWNNDESFIKIGKTFRSIDERLRGIVYNYEVLTTVEADAKTVSILERKYQQANVTYKYQPMIKFNGHTESFSSAKIKDITYEA